MLANMVSSPSWLLEAGVWSPKKLPRKTMKKSVVDTKILYIPFFKAITTIVNFETGFIFTILYYFPGKGQTD